MRHFAWSRAAALTSLAAAVAGVAVVAGMRPSDSNDASAADASGAVRETPRQGLVARLPRVGTLTWRCDRKQRFFTELTLPSPGATVFVGIESDGKRVWRRRQVNPAVTPEATVVGPFRALERQTWTIRYHHAPATLRVVARLRFAAPPPRAECLVTHAGIDIRRRPH
jgi:hypothetical protein